MSNKVSNNNQERSYNVGAREYERLKSKFCEDHRITMSGKNNPFYGKTHSNETKKMISKTKIKANLRGERSYSFGRKHSEETKRKMSQNAPHRTGKNNPFLWQNSL